LQVVKKKLEVVIGVKERWSCNSVIVRGAVMLLVEATPTVYGASLL
jgi:hypothetical protein